MLKDSGHFIKEFKMLNFQHHIARIAKPVSDWLLFNQSLITQTVKAKSTRLTQNYLTHSVILIYMM